MPGVKNKVMSLRLDEKAAERLAELSRMYNLPQAEFLRRLVGGGAIPDPANFMAVEALAEMNMLLRHIRGCSERMTGDPEFDKAAARKVTGDLDAALGMIRDIVLHLDGTEPPPLRTTKRYIQLYFGSKYLDRR